MKKRGLAAAFKSITLEDSSRVIFRRRSPMKNKKKKILTMVVVYSLLGTLGGCRFERNVDISIPTELEKTQSEMNQNDEDMSQVQNESARTSAETLSVVYKNIDLNLFAQVFMETSTIEEAEKYKPKHSLGEYYYEIGGKTIVYTGITSGIISYDDATDGAGDCYDAIINSLGYLTNGMGNSFRQLCPDENLDTCTKEQAIEACSKYAQACGYGSDCDITVYAFTLDAIEKVNKVFYDSISAPGEGFDIVTKGQVEELRDEGKDEEAAKKLIDEALAIEKAGAFAVVLECVPAKLAAIISEKLSIPTIGIGAGVNCDGQILVYQDMLGVFSDFTPKFVKKYENLGEKMNIAFRKYIEEIKDGVFPAEEHSFKISDEAIEKLY